MIEPIECPSDAWLDRFEDFQSDESQSDALCTIERLAIERHIESCSYCQQRLERKLDCQKKSLEELLPEPISGYRILKVLGQGGQARVVLAHELSTQRQVALKLIPKPLNRSESDLQAWRNEILVAARMDHLHLVRLYSVQENQHSFILVFEYVPGGTLDSLLARNWTPMQIARVLSQVARGLFKIHSMGFLHLDLKPSNILIDSNNQDDPEQWIAKISDFGISLKTPGPIRNHCEDSDSLKEMHGLGTFEYMAPEQALGIRAVLTPQTDLFALGRISQQLLRRSANSNPKSSLESLCDRCCQIDPTRRFRSAQEFIEAIDGWIAKQDRKITDQKSKWAKRFVALAAILLLTLVAVSRWDPKAENPPVSQPLGIASEPLANRDLAEWISQLDTPPEALTNATARGIANASAYWTNDCLDSRLAQQQPEQAIRYAVLQRAAAERIATKVNTQHLPLARELLGNSTRILSSLRSISPQDPRVLNELITTHFVAGSLRYHIDDIPKYGEYFESRMIALQEVCFLVQHLVDPIQQVYWSTRVLDELRVSRRLARWGAQPSSLSCVERIEASCGETLRAYQANDPRLDVPDLSVRLMLLEAGKKDRKIDDLEVLQRLELDDPSDKPWVFAEDTARLLHELIATELGRPIFESSQTDPKDFELLIDRLGQHAATGAQSDAMVPVFQEDLFRFVASISTHHRLTGQVDQSHKIQRGYIAACDALMKRFPDHPNLYLARSEGLLQAWKNALRKDDSIGALESLKESYEASKRALELAPNNPLAHHQVSDRLKRIARFQSSH
jgi:serine/threonine protein kinase